MQNDKSKIVDHESPSEIYKLAVKIRKVFNKTFSKKSRGFLGNMFIAIVAITFVCVILYPAVFDGKEVNVKFIIFLFIYMPILSCIRRFWQKEGNALFKECVRLIPNSIVTFSISYGYVALLVTAAYFSLVRIGFINLDPEEKIFPVDDVYVVITICIISMLIAILSYQPTSLMIKGYMQRYDPKWKEYSHNMYYLLVLVIFSLFLVILIGFKFTGYELPERLREYVVIRYQASVTIVAYIIHLCFMLYAQYKVEEEVFGHLDV